MPIYGKVVRKVLKKASTGDWLEGLVRKVRFGKAKEWKLIVRTTFMDEKTLESMVDFIEKTRVVSPNNLAERFKVKVSTCRKFLEELTRLGFLRRLESAGPGIYLYEYIAQAERS
ncbi:MAG: FeoC-like transcriptional regulator [Crenarchaeota archaeon]|nr:FeoC-like transcriptional regulator [Thermoproteota archaeon]MCR8454018.1 FeoC-like transcriptional regulator [Thermoproteota archaeon]MCR8454995.1 FeoC-like transcriptional regulator [Thermoproteota archaeon]MCR8470443.1 FeoC-like transcriptional regulator [Thermoproteota archaeon]MCR8471460.1 FeoC-like transcriptional regulator [Thermoproteota archaeon]